MRLIWLSGRSYVSKIIRSMALDAEVDAEREAEAAVKGTFSHVEAWHTAPRKEPLAGSKLAADNMAWLPMPMSEMVRLELDLAAEQFHQVKVMVNANELSLSAQRVLVRTALIASSIATWILCPEDSEERQARHRLLIEQTTFRHHQALSEQADLERAAELPVQPNLQIMVDHTARRLREVRERRAKKLEVAKWNDTEIIERASSYAFRNQSDPSALAREAVLEFRTTSGAAHGLAWALFNSTGIKTAGSPDQHGRVLMTAAPTFSALANGYMAAYWISVAGWRLLEARSQV